MLVHEIWTDGSCWPPNGENSGGWAAVIRHDRNIEEIHGNTNNTTSQRMELMAALKALEAIPPNSQVELYTDSQYLCHSFTRGWLKMWENNGWKKGKLKNVDLWMRLAELSKLHQINWHWVRGHDGNPFNERADELAEEARKSRPISQVNLFEETKKIDEQFNNALSKG